MTCLDKLRELHPEWDDETIGLCVKNRCPELYMEIETPSFCPARGDLGRVDLVCGTCWVRDYIEPVPHEFEYSYGSDMRFHVTVLERSTNYFTGGKVYKIRTDVYTGWVNEDWVTEEYIRDMLQYRVEDEE